MKKTALILSTLLSLGLVACKTEQDASAMTLADQTTQPAPAQAGAEIRVNGGKPSPAPISMNYQILTENPKAGQEIEVQVGFSSQLKSAIHTRISEPERFSLLNSTRSFTTQPNQFAKPGTSPKLVVVAPEDGIYYLRLIATIELDGQPVSKPFVIPVKVGSGEVKLQPVGEKVTDDSGQTLIIQKADDN